MSPAVVVPAPVFFEQPTASAAIKQIMETTANVRINFTIALPIDPWPSEYVLGSFRR